jgi:hypothetical protein
MQLPARLFRPGWGRRTSAREAPLNLSFAPPEVSVAQISVSSTTMLSASTGNGTGPAATASGIPVRSSRLVASASWYPYAPGRTLSSPVSTPNRKPLASSSVR